MRPPANKFRIRAMVEDKRRNQTKEFNGGLQTEEIASGAVACAGAPH